MKKFTYVLCIFVVVLTSCSSPVTLSHYSIEFLVPQNASNSTAITQDSVGIETFSAIKALQRNEILVRANDTNQVLFSSHNFWWALPSEMVNETFHNYLQSQNLFQHVVRYPTLQKIKYVLQGKIHRFEVQQNNEAWQTVTAIQLTVVDAESQKILWESGTVQNTTPCEANMQDAAKAMEKNLVGLYNKLLLQFKTFLKVS